MFEVSGVLRGVFCVTNPNPDTAAALLPSLFVRQVDREERPDVDQCFMNFVQATTGGGGWPMSVWLTPDLKPFTGATYFPERRFIGVLNLLADKWSSDRCEASRRRRGARTRFVLRVLPVYFCALVATAAVG